MSDRRRGRAAAPRAGVPLSGADRAWLRMDDPTNLMLVSGVLVFDEPLDRGSVAALIQERLLTIPRFRCRVANDERGRPCWTEADDLDLAAHLRSERLPGPGTDRELADLVSRLLSTPLDMSRPPWCFHLVENYRGGSALLGRLHHAIADGIALMLVLLSLTDQEDGGPSPLVELFRGGGTDAGWAERLVGEALPEGMKLLSQPVRALRRTSRLVRAAGFAASLTRLAFCLPDPRTPLKGRLGTAKRAAWSGPIPLAPVHEARSRAGGTVNDILLTAVTGGLRRYLEARGPAPERLSVRATVPVNLRPLEKMWELGNEFGLVFLPLPVGLREPLPRFERLRANMSRLKRSAEPVVILSLLKLVARLPRVLQAQTVRAFATKATAVVTSVPGPRRPLSLAGRRLGGMYFWVPQSGRLGLGISLCSYAGAVRIGVATDARLIPDPDRLVRDIEGDLDELLLAIGAAR